MELRVSYRAQIGFERRCNHSIAVCEGNLSIDQDSECTMTIQTTMCRVLAQSLEAAASKRHEMQWNGGACRPFNDLHGPEIVQRRLLS